MRRSNVVLVAALLGGLALPALASPIISFNYSGTINSGGDPNTLFGGGNPLNGPYAGSISYDAAATSACNGVMHFCQVNITAATGVSESFTFNGITQTFSITGGQIQFNTGGGSSNQIGFYGLSGPNGFNGSIQFNGGSSFFGGGNVINTSLTAGAGSGQGNFDVGTQFDTYFNFPFTTARASSGTPVPEPGALGLFSAGLLGLAFMALRRRARPGAGLAIA